MALALAAALGATALGGVATASAAPAPAAPAPAPAAPAAGVVRAAGPGLDLPPVDLSTLSMIPTAMGGVVNPDPARTQTSSLASYVWAIRQAGSKIFVGGMFLDVKENATATAVRQPFLAAFDLDTGAWDSTCRPALDNAVYALAVSPTGSLLVGGEFTTVNGLPRTGLVALDPATCAVDPTFPDLVQRPYSTTRAVVRDLVVAGGKLYVGGNFSRVVGPAKKGVTLVTSVDATPPATATKCAAQGATCTLTSGTTSTVWFGADTRWTLKRYLTGSFACTTTTFGGDPAPGAVKSCTAATDGTTTTGVYKVARVDATTGAIDFAWKPQVTGSGVWGLAVDVPRGRIHLGGWFSGVGGVTGTNNYAVVDGTTGALVTGLTKRPLNNTARMEIYDVELGSPDRVYVGGSEHILQMLDAGTGAQLAFAHTGYNGCETTRFTWCSYIGSGGDYQVAERVGDYVFGGCHCTRAAVGSSKAHYSSVSKTFTTHHHLVAYDAATEAVVDSFQPDIDGSVEGVWAVGSDTNGCLYIGGDYTKGGAAAGRSMWLSGIAKLCPKAAPKPAGDTTAPTAPRAVEAADTGGGAVQVSWTASTDAVGVDHYTVTASTGATLQAAASPATLPGVPAGSTTFTVTAVDAAGNVSDGGAMTTTVGRTGGDTASPTAPAGLAVAAAATGGAALTWTASTDDVGVKSYLVYRNGSYVGWSATPGWTDTSAPKGSELTYTVRATDAAGNRSVRSAAAVVTL